MATLQTLIDYCREQASITPNDYFEPGYAKPEEIAGWRSDRNTRDRARAKCFKRYPARLKFAPESETLRPGNYGRLTILPDGSPDYTAGQYAPVEVYGYLLRYLDETNAN